MPVDIASPKSQDPEQFRLRLTRYIRSIVRDVGEAEDLAQETLLRAHLQKDSLRDLRALESWLYKTATNVSIDRLRKRAGTVKHNLQTPVEDLPLADQGHPSPFEIVQQDEMSQCVQRYLADLSNTHPLACGSPKCLSIRMPHSASHLRCSESKLGTCA